MFKSMRVRASILAAAVATSLCIAAAPASAQQQGLVNVEVSNVLNDNEVAVAIPINAAANVCGVSVNVLSTMLAGPDPVVCLAGANQRFTITQ
jgi:hypothetical protein